MIEGDYVYGGNFDVEVFDLKNLVVVKEGKLKYVDLEDEVVVKDVKWKKCLSEEVINLDNFGCSLRRVWYMEMLGDEVG